MFDSGGINHSQRGAATGRRVTARSQGHQVLLRTKAGPSAIFKHTCRPGTCWEQVESGSGKTATDNTPGELVRVRQTVLPKQTNISRQVWFCDGLPADDAASKSDDYLRRIGSLLQDDVALLNRRADGLTQVARTYAGQFLGYRANMLAWVPDCFQGQHASLGAGLIYTGQFHGSRTNMLAWVPDCFQGLRRPVPRLQDQHASLGTRLFQEPTQASSTAPGPTC
ncbi:hypothetical protein Bbelb_222890 [Branchiostoma belcheri]|nr:hypothetical protein Bbelb_222890 [Branchiostoma belcheri]